MEQLGGRKFLYVLLVTSMGFGLVLTKLASSVEWFNFTQAVALLFFAGNVGEKVANNLKNNP